jgi:hypothetical protein
MIYESLIAPSEFSIVERDVKRALLTYDKVKLVDPADRDVMPANTFMSTIMGIPLMGFNNGPVRPMGKINNYDDKFSQVIDNLKPAIRQGLVETISTYNQNETKGFTIGGIPTGGYPLNTQFVFGLYRTMAQNQAFLKSAISSDAPNLIKLLDSEPNIALSGGGDCGINNIPALPIIDTEELSSEQAQAITQIARSRIASFIKYAGYCEQKNLIPVFPSKIYGNIAENVLSNTHSILKIVEKDDFWIRRNRVLSLCHEEYLVDELLDQMTIENVLKLRTKTWGKQANAREELFTAISTISAELSDEEDFMKSAKSRISEYRKLTADLELERKNIKYKINCDVGIGLLGGGAGLTGLLSQIESPLSSIGLTLVAGGMWTIEKSKDYIPALRELKKQDEELKRGAGLGIHNFYSRIK